MSCLGDKSPLALKLSQLLDFNLSRSIIFLKLADDDDDVVAAVAANVAILGVVVAAATAVFVVFVDVRPRIRLSKPLNDDMFMNRFRPTPLVLALLCSFIF